MNGGCGTTGGGAVASRTPWGIAYRVEGAEIDIEYLAYVLRLAVEDPTTSPHDFALGRDRLAMDLERHTESPAARLLSRLREAAAPDRPPHRGI
ncbi:MAG: hypothetical protein O2992_14880, partial [Gemmatimonadetes bacterium]|nr:hypothetical protein [Gemmatimonadota bacterium]